MRSCPNRDFILCLSELDVFDHSVYQAPGALVMQVSGRRPSSKASFAMIVAVAFSSPTPAISWLNHCLVPSDLQSGPAGDLMYSAKADVCSILGSLFGSAFQGSLCRAWQKTPLGSATCRQAQQKSFNKNMKR